MINHHGYELASAIGFIASKTVLIDAKAFWPRVHIVLTPFALKLVVVGLIDKIIRTGILTTNAL